MIWALLLEADHASLRAFSLKDFVRYEPFKYSVDFAEADHRGALGAIAGLGDTTLARIRDWVAQNPRKRQDVLKPAAPMQKQRTNKTSKEKDEN